MFLLMLNIALYCTSKVMKHPKVYYICVVIETRRVHVTVWLL